jgi:hypothetical protein
MTTQPTCPTCGAVDRPACIEEFHFVPPSPDVSGDEEWDEFRTHEHFGNRLGDRTRCCYRAGLNARRNPQQTDEAIRAALHDLEGQLPCSDETCQCCAAIWPRVKRVLDVLRGEK